VGWAIPIEIRAYRSQQSNQSNTAQPRQRQPLHLPKSVTSPPSNFRDVPIPHSGTRPTIGCQRPIASCVVVEFLVRPPVVFSMPRRLSIRCLSRCVPDVQYPQAIIEDAIEKFVRVSHQCGNMNARPLNHGRTTFGILRYPLPLTVSEPLGHSAVYRFSLVVHPNLLYPRKSKLAKMLDGNESNGANG
jgi:hypothetical protein